MNSNSRNIMRALALIGALAATTVVGCDISKTLSVEPANLIPAVTLEAPENAALLVAGVRVRLRLRVQLVRRRRRADRRRVRGRATDGDLAGHTISAP